MNPIRVGVPAVLFISTMLLLTACGGEGDSSPNNFTATALQVDTPDPRIAYPLKVSMQIAADDTAANLSVSLFAIDRTDDPEAEVRQIPLGTESIPEVATGLASYELNVTLPSSIELPGDYYLAAIVDPVDEFGETNEDDNTASVELTIAVEGNPNVLLTELELDRLALLLNTDNYVDQVTGAIGNVYNADAGATITVGADGLSVNETIDIEAFASLRMTRSDNNTTHDVPLYLWNSELERYMNAYGVDPSGNTSSSLVEWLPLGTFAPQLVETVGEDVTLNDVKLDSTQLNFYTPGELGNVMEEAMRYPIEQCGGFNCTNSVPLPTVPPPDLTAQAISQLVGFLTDLPITTPGDESTAMAVMSFAICVEIRPTNLAIADSDSNDNELCSPLSVTLPPLDPPPPPPPELAGYVPQYSTPSGPLSSGDGYGTKGGGSAFSFGPIDYGASSTADHHGYIEEIHGGIPITVFGGLFNFVDVSVTAQLVPDYNGKPFEDETGFTVELRFLNLMLDSIDSGPVSFDTGPASWQATMSFSKEAPEPPKEKQFFVGPVPMVASASIAGNIGVQYEFAFEEDKIFDGRPHLALGNTVSPFASIEATLSAGVGSPLFSAGVEGVLTLLDERLEFFIGTRIFEHDLGFSSGNAEFIIIQGETLSNVFTGPQGAINLFAKYTVPKVVTCSWGFIKGKCIKAKTIKATKNIWRSPALFRFDDILYDSRDVLLDVVVLDGKEPMYFTDP